MSGRRETIGIAILTAVAMLWPGSGAGASGEGRTSAPAQLRRDGAPGRAGAAVGEPDLMRTIGAADGSETLDELTVIVRTAASCCRASRPVGSSLTAWLRESHPIHEGRLPTEAAQFRAFLLASLGSFPPTEELFGYVRSEFLFGGHPISIAAAAIAARAFADRSDELLPVMEPYLRDAFHDAWVDVTTPELHYPPVTPTRARHEIIRTLAAFGRRAWPAVAQLDAVASCANCGAYAYDPALTRLAAEAADSIRKATPPCCRITTAAAAATPLTILAPRQRRPFPARSLKLVDQDGRPLQFAALRGRPFALTFFYSQCPNPRKCILTVRRLGDLASACAAAGLADEVGIYGMTYDPHFDSPSILKKYGSMHGMVYSRHVRLLKTEGQIAPDLREALALRVSYGAGSVNQHGVQLFLFDRQGRVAAVHDNELWSPEEVRKSLAGLVAE